MKRALVTGAARGIGRAIAEALAVDERRSTFMPCLWTLQAGAPREQVVEQTWFAGVHSDVGGGYKDDGLSNDTLSWMWRRAEQAGLGLDKKQYPKPNPFGTLHNSLTGLFKVLSWFHSGRRKIKLKDAANAEHTNQAVHDSVKQRFDKQNPAYHPKNLVNYLKDPKSVYVSS